MVRWFRKREFMFYYLIYKYLNSRGRDCANLGELLDLIEIPAGGKSIGRRIIKSLVRRGLLVMRGGDLGVCARDLKEVLDSKLRLYIKARVQRLGKLDVLKNVSGDSPARFILEVLEGGRDAEEG
jgi:hypothetical protein